jgi:hypothetical protein
MREGRGENAVPDVLKEDAFYEALAWWFTIQRIGQGLRERYEVPKDLPPKLLGLVRKLDDNDWLVAGVSWRNDADFLP